LFHFAHTHTHAHTCTHLTNITIYYNNNNNNQIFIAPYGRNFVIFGTLTVDKVSIFISPVKCYE